MGEEKREDENEGGRDLGLCKVPSVCCAFAQLDSSFTDHVLVCFWFFYSFFNSTFPMLSQTLETSTPQIHPGPSPLFSILQGESFPWCGLSGIWWVLLSCFFF